MSGDFRGIMKDDAKIWCVTSEWGSMTLYADEEYAKDRMTRKDKLFSFVVTQFKEEQP